MIELNNISFKYDSSCNMVLEDVNIKLDKKEILAIVGSSGCGKSTLLRLIAGLDDPSTGEISIENKVLFDSNYTVPTEKRGVGMLFQDYALFPHMTVEQNICFGISRMKKEDRKTRLVEMLSLVNLTGYEKRYPHQLSGGQQQRVALARALAPKPSVLLLDEPFSNLDTHLIDKVRSALTDIIKQSGITTIIVTHNIDDAKFMADKIFSLENGKGTLIEKSHFD